MSNELLQEFEDLATDTTISIEDLDAKVVEMTQRKAEYEAAKLVSSERYGEYQRAQQQLIEMMRQSNKKKYHVVGYGTATVNEKLKVKTPKSLEAKQALYNWIKNREGEEGLLAQTTVNYNTLQRMYNDAFEEAKLAGTLENFKVDGVDTPEAEYTLSFRK